MELHEALRHISTTRDAAVKAEMFCGYSAATAEFSAILGVAAAQQEAETQAAGRLRTT